MFAVCVLFTFGTIDAVASRLAVFARCAVETFIATTLAVAINAVLTLAVVGAPAADVSRAFEAVVAIKTRATGVSLQQNMRLEGWTYIVLFPKAFKDIVYISRKRLFIQQFTGICRRHLMRQPGTDFLLLPTRFLYLQLGFMLAGNCSLVCNKKYTETLEKKARRANKANIKKLHVSQTLIFAGGILTGLLPKRHRGASSQSEHLPWGQEEKSEGVWPTHWPFWHHPFTLDSSASSKADPIKLT